MGADETEIEELLAGCMDEGRRSRAAGLVSDVELLIHEPDLVIAAVSSYNVSVDAHSRRVVHGCRDFRSRAPAGGLCKHVGAVLMALDPVEARSIVEGILARDGGWRLECIQRYTPR